MIENQIEKATRASEAHCKLVILDADLDVSGSPCTSPATWDETQNIDGRMALNMLSQFKHHKEKQSKFWAHDLTLGPHESAELMVRENAIPDFTTQKIHTRPGDAGYG